MIYKQKTVFTRENCQLTSNQTGNLTVAKNLLNEGYDLSKTIIIDDREDVVSCNERNSILIPPYNPKFTIGGILQDDDSLLRIIEWMKINNFDSVRDVRDLNYNIFNIKMESEIKLAERMREIHVK